jgi:hypothetical protein
MMAEGPLTLKEKAVKTWTTLLACVAVLAFATGLCAQDEKPKHDTARVPMAVGKVVSLDKEAKLLTVSVTPRGGGEATEAVFAITDATKVILPGDTREGKPGTLDDVKKDARVLVIYKAAEGDAKPAALSIRVMGERPAAK